MFQSSFTALLFFWSRVAAWADLEKEREGCTSVFLCMDSEGMPFNLFMHTFTHKYTSSNLNTKTLEKIQENFWH